MNEDANASSSWQRYLVDVYGRPGGGEGGVGEDGAAFNWFYWSAPQAPTRVWWFPNSTAYGPVVRADDGIIHMYGELGYFRRPRSADANVLAPSVRRVEVMRRWSPHEKDATWYYHARGSGIFLNVGRLQRQDCGGEEWPGPNATVHACAPSLMWPKGLRRRGIDVVIRWPPRLFWWWGRANLKEVVDVRPPGGPISVCGHSARTQTHLHCSAACDDSQHLLNCGARQPPAAAQAKARALHDHGVLRRQVCGVCEQRAHAAPLCALSIRAFLAAARARPCERAHFLWPPASASA